MGICSLNIINGKVIGPIIFTLLRKYWTLVGNINSLGYTSPAPTISLRYKTCDYISDGKLFKNCEQTFRK